MTKQYKYLCFSCGKRCELVCSDTPDDVEDTITGYDSQKDCEYYFVLDGEVFDQQ